MSTRPGAFNRANALLVAALSAGVVFLAAATAIGARQAAGAEESLAGAPGGTRRGALSAEPVVDPETGQVIDPVTGEVAPASPGSVRVTGPGGRATTGAGPSTGGKVGTGTVQLPGTREGVHADHFEFGVHAPMTIDGAPLNIAEDPIIGFKGYITHVNRQGGVNGRKVRLFLVDDRYTTDGGAQSRDRLVKEVKPFFISGTLGVDQVAIVAKAAGEAKIPYMAIGGPEPEWKTIGMYQVGSSYDQYAEMLAKWICAQGQAYVGEPVRIGITTLNSPYIRPVEERFVTRVKSACNISVDSKARGYVEKPTQQTTYTNQLLAMRGAYDNKGPNLLIPLQDPVTTSRQVAEWCTGQRYCPKWTFSNFAHDSETTLALMGGEWAGVRGLTGACHYQYDRAFDPAVCANMKQAHDEWLALGKVVYDENAGGCAGGKCDYDYKQSTWDEDGSGGASGYQLVHFWLGAMRAIGADPTREQFVAALNAYVNYSDLITSPITFKGVPNIMHGAEKMAVIEANPNRQTFKFRQVTPGLVDQF